MVSMDIIHHLQLMQNLHLQSYRFHYGNHQPFQTIKYVYIHMHTRYILFWDIKTLIHRPLPRNGSSQIWFKSTINITHHDIAPMLMRNIIIPQAFPMDDMSLQTKVPNLRGGGSSSMIPTNANNLNVDDEISVSCTSIISSLEWASYNETTISIALNTEAQYETIMPAPIVS
jgi:hypothetical protein